MSGYTLLRGLISISDDFGVGTLSFTEPILSPVIDKDGFYEKLGK